MFKKVPRYVWLMIPAAGYIFFRGVRSFSDLHYYGMEWLLVLFLLGIALLIAILIWYNIKSTAKALAAFNSRHTGLNVLSAAETGQMELVALSVAHPGDDPIENWKGMERRVLIHVSPKELSLWRWNRKSPDKFLCFARIKRKDVIGVIARAAGITAVLAFAVDAAGGPIEFQLVALGKRNSGRASLARAEELVAAVREALNN